MRVNYKNTLLLRNFLPKGKKPAYLKNFIKLRPIVFAQTLFFTHLQPKEISTHLHTVNCCRPLPENRVCCKDPKICIATLRKIKGSTFVFSRKTSIIFSSKPPIGDGDIQAKSRVDNWAKLLFQTNRQKKMTE